ncbi:Integrase catalytic domain-containing protein [Balamuthia mandrillaris]
MILCLLKDKSVEEVSHEFVKIICKLGFPKIIQSDNGTEFVNKIMSASTFLPIAQFALNQHISRHSDSKPFELFFDRPLSYLENYFESISKPKIPCEITSLTKVILQIIYSSIYEKVAKYSTNIENALKLVDPNTPFEDKHFKVEKVLYHDGPPSDCYYLMKWKGYPNLDNSWVAAKDFSSQRPITTYWGKKYPKTKKRCK